MLISALLSANTRASGKSEFGKLRGAKTAAIRHFEVTACHLTRTLEHMANSGGASFMAGSTRSPAKPAPHAMSREITR
jgi:hypothetical protein